MSENKGAVESVVKSEESFAIVVCTNKNWLKNTILLQIVPVTIKANRLEIKILMNTPFVHFIFDVLVISNKQILIPLKK